MPNPAKNHTKPLPLLSAMGVSNQSVLNAMVALA